MLVEDNPINQMVASGFLQEWDIQIDIANNGIEALKLLKQAQKDVPYFLILMDCQMPIMDGYTTSQQIRAGKSGEYYRDIPIIAMTANAMQGDREKCLAAGMSDYLSKPLTLKQIQNKLCLWLPDKSNSR